MFCEVGKNKWKPDVEKWFQIFLRAFCLCICRCLEWILVRVECDVIRDAGWETSKNEGRPDVGWEPKKFFRASFP